MGSSVQTEILRDIISKVLTYTSDSSSNPQKLLKYLKLLRQVRPSSRHDYIESKLRSAGVIRKLIIYFNKHASNCDSESSTSSKFSGIQSTQSTSASNITETQLTIMSNGLSILGNAFAVDEESRKEAEKYKFVGTLKTFLESKELRQLGYPDVVSRLTKCLANLAVSENIRLTVLTHGIGILLLNILEDIYNKLAKNSKTSSKNSLEEVIVEKNEEVIIVEAVRALRIFSKQCQFQQHLVRVGAILIVGRFLRFSYNETLFSEILKALAELFSNTKGISRTTLIELTDADGSEKDILIKIICFLKTRHAVSKVFEPTLTCLTHLARNTLMATALLEFEVFEAGLEALKHSEETSRLEKLLRLFVLLTKDISASNGYLSSKRLACCAQLGETLKILTNTSLKHYHHWILSLYENLYEEKLKDLVSRGVLRILDKYVRQEWGEFSMESLRPKISCVDNESCPVHAQQGSNCPFYPQYSCSSPSYEQAKKSEEMKRVKFEGYGKNHATFLESNGCISPTQTPPHSPSGSDNSSSMKYSPIMFSKESPTYSYTLSPQSCSEDEGIYSSSSRSPASVHSMLSVSKRDNTCTGLDYSEDESETEPCSSMVGICSAADAMEPPTKKAKIDVDINSRQLNDAVTTPAELENGKASGVFNSKINFNKGNRLCSSNTAAILGILNRCSHFPVLPSELIIFVPFLLELIWSGRLSVEKRHLLAVANFPVEQAHLRRLCFQRAFKIMFRLSSDISMFPKLVRDNYIPCIYRILVYGLKVNDLQDEKQINLRDFIKDYSTKIMDALVGVLDSKNKTGGWRQGYFQSICCVGEQDPVYTSVILSIPHLYRRQCPIYRDFEDKTRRWNKIFQLLIDVDNIPFTVFQDSVLALTCVSQTKGIKWVDAELACTRKLLYCGDKFPSEQSDNGSTVLVELDDGFELNIEKKLLIESSPVFSAMFDGYFLEATRQHVHLRDTSRAALNALITQLYQQWNPESDASVSTSTDHELLTLLELLSLADKFLLNNLYDRTLNTIISYYFCPYSAPKIYMESLKFKGSHSNKDHDLSKLALKYLLACENISFTLRTGALWKIFDAVTPTEVVQGIRDVLYSDKA